MGNNLGKKKYIYVLFIFLEFIFLQGDKGYCYIPYEYMTNTRLCFDAWAIRKVAVDDFGKNHWDTDDSIDYRTLGNPADDNNDEYHLVEDDE